MGADRLAQNEPGVSRRRILGIGAGGIGTALLAACGATGNQASNTSTGAATRPAGSTAPNTQAATSVSGKILWQIRDQPEYEGLSKWAIDEFKKKYPNVTVEASPVNVGNTEKTIAQMVAGSGPDVFQGWNTIQVQYAAKGATMNLTDLAKMLPQADVNDFVDAQWKGMVIPTTNFRYGMPTYVNMFVLYYNKTIFQRRGVAEPTAEWNHDIYADNLKKLTYDEGGKQVWGGFARVDIFDRQYHVRAFGGNYVEPNSLTKMALDQEAAQKALEWEYARLWTDRTWAPIEDRNRTWQPAAQQEGFAQGALSTFEDGLDKLNTVGTKMAQGNEWNIMHMPKGPAQRNSLVTTDSWAMWKNTKVKDAAWELMKFITNKEFYEQQAKLVGYTPSRKSVMESWVSTMKAKGPSFANVNYKVVTDALAGASGFNYLTVDQVFQCQKEAQDVLGPAINAILRTGEKTPAYMREIKDQVNQAAAGCNVSLT